jgi:hypothetical protein
MAWSEEYFEHLLFQSGFADQTEASIPVHENFYRARPGSGPFLFIYMHRSWGFALLGGDFFEFGGCFPFSVRGERNA